MKNKKIFYFWGSGGAAEEIKEVISDNFKNKNYRIIYINKKNTKKQIVKKINFYKKRKNLCYGIVASGNPAIREKMFNEIKKLKLKTIKLIHLTSHISSKAKLEAGCIISAFCSISPRVIIKKGCFINKHCSIDHNTSIGAYSVLSPGSRVTGNVKVGLRSFMGTNSVALPGIKIGNDVKVGVGVTLSRNVSNGSTVLFRNEIKIFK